MERKAFKPAVARAQVRRQFIVLALSLVLSLPMVHLRESTRHQGEVAEGGRRVGQRQPHLRCGYKVPSLGRNGTSALQMSHALR